MLNIFIFIFILIILVIFLIYNQPNIEKFTVTTHEEACNELLSNRLKLARQISNLRNPNQNIVTTMDEAYKSKDENMNYQHQYSDTCSQYLTLADGDPMKEACKLLASVDKYQFPVLSSIDIYNFNLLSSAYDMNYVLNELNFYADLIKCPRPPEGSASVTYDLYGASNCLVASGGSACTNTFVHLNTNAADKYTGNTSNITLHKYNDPNQRQTGLDKYNDINIFRDIGQLNTQTLAYNLERLSPYYISPDLLEYILNFLISQDNLKYLSYDSLNFAKAERCAQYGIMNPNTPCPYPSS
jgi:hypothetical protein